MGKSLDFVKKEVDLKKNCFEFGAEKVFDYFSCKAQERKIYGILNLCARI